MARGRKTSVVIDLTSNDRATLQGWMRQPSKPWGVVRRAQIILGVADKISIVELQRRTGMARHIIYKWLDRYQVGGIISLQDKPGRGRRTVKEDATHD